MARTASAAVTRGYLDRLLAIGNNWPSDPLRPDLHFGRAIELAARKALVKPAPGAAAAAAAAQIPAAAAAAAAAASASTSALASTAQQGQTLVLRELNTADGGDVQIVERATAALDGLRANKVYKRHPTPRQILKPASQPEYYSRLVNTLDRAGRGEDVSPTWQEKFSRFFGRAP